MGCIVHAVLANLFGHGLRLSGQVTGAMAQQLAGLGEAEDGGPKGVVDPFRMSNRQNYCNKFTLASPWPFRGCTKPS